MSKLITKRQRIAPGDVVGPVARASPQQVTLLHDVFMEASRKQSSHLLSVLLQACSSTILDQVFTEAVKIGACKSQQQQRPTNAPFQTCTHQKLDMVFSFLDKKDLEVVEITCRRWRYACRDSHAGWRAYL